MWTDICFSLSSLLLVVALRLQLSCSIIGNYRLLLLILVLLLTYVWLVWFYILFEIELVIFQIISKKFIFKRSLQFYKFMNYSSVVQQILNFQVSTICTIFTWYRSSYAFAMKHMARNTQNYCHSTAVESALQMTFLILCAMSWSSRRTTESIAGKIHRVLVTIAPQFSSGFTI